MSVIDHLRGYDLAAALARVHAERFDVHTTDKRGKVQILQDEQTVLVPAEHFAGQQVAFSDNARPAAVRRAEQRKHFVALLVDCVAPEFSSVEMLSTIEPPAEEQSAGEGPVELITAGLCGAARADALVQRREEWTALIQTCDDLSMLDQMRETYDEEWKRAVATLVQMCEHSAELAVKVAEAAAEGEAELNAKKASGIVAQLSASGSSDFGTSLDVAVAPRIGRWCEIMQPVPNSLVHTTRASEDCLPVVNTQQSFCGPPPMGPRTAERARAEAARVVAELPELSL